MIHLETEVEGEQMTFGEAKRYLKQFGFYMGGNWEYDRGMFDGILHREGGETIYLRMPFFVVEGELDHHDALIEFQKPFVIKHIVNLGLAKDSSALLTATGFGQFQKPLDKDGHISNKNQWQEFGEDVVEDILKHLK